MVEGRRNNLLCLVLLLVATGSNFVAGQFDPRNVPDLLEVPRIERMQPESASDCTDKMNCITQNSDSPVNAMWFGPRLGRRRRSDQMRFPTPNNKPVWKILSVPPLGTGNKNPSLVRTDLEGPLYNDVINRFDESITQRDAAALERELLMRYFLRKLRAFETI